MIRDLAGFARVAGGALQGENAAFGPVASDSRTLEPGALFVALARRALRRPRLRRPGGGTRRRGRRRQPAGRRRGGAGRRARHAGRADPLRQRVAPGLRRHRGRHHRQQRQDHGQGDDRRDPRRLRSVPRHQGQPEQPHRRAAHARAARRHAPLCGDRDGREPPGRDRATRGDLRAGRRARHQRRPGAPRGLRRHRGSRARQGRDVRGARRRRTRR